VRIDSLATDRERLMLADYLPPGSAEEDVRLVLPALGAADSLSGVACQPCRILGRPAMLETTFREGTLRSCGYSLCCTDSVLAAALYRELQRTYTMALGNYHETFADGEHPARSFWSSADCGLVVTLGAAPEGFRLSWRFEQLPPVDHADPPATESGTRDPA